MWRIAIFIRHICGKQKILLDIAALEAQNVTIFGVYCNKNNAMIRHSNEERENLLTYRKSLDFLH